MKMKMNAIIVIAGVLAAGGVVVAHEHQGDPRVYLSAQGPHKERLWYNTLPGDGGTQVFCSFCSETCGGEVADRKKIRRIRCSRGFQRLGGCRIFRVWRLRRRRMILRSWERRLIRGLLIDLVRGLDLRGLGRGRGGLICSKFPFLIGCGPGEG